MIVVNLASAWVGNSEVRLRLLRLREIELRFTAYYGMVEEKCYCLNNTSKVESTITMEEEKAMLDPLDRNVLDIDR